jgi:hypothetical protein
MKQMTEDKIRKIVREELVKIKKEEADGLVNPKKDDRGKGEVQKDKTKDNEILKKPDGE